MTIIRILAAIFISIPILAGCEPDHPQYLSPETKHIMQSRDLTKDQAFEIGMVDIDYAKAPAANRAIAYKIVLGEPLAESELRALGPDIDRAFPFRDETHPDRRARTLLMTALDQKNLAAIEALLAAGASPYELYDPDNTSNQIRYRSFISQAMKPGWNFDHELQKYDYSFNNKVLMLFLKYGGDPNFELPGASFKKTILLNAWLTGNFDGFKLLLMSNGDPTIDGLHGAAFHLNLIWSGPNNHEYIRYLADEGYYDKVDTVEIRKLFPAVERNLDVGIRTDPNVTRKIFYDEFGKYADAIKIILKRTNYILEEDE